MKKYKRVFTIVIDSLGIGAMPDGEKFGDVGVNTLGHISEAVENFRIPTLQKLGMANLTPLRQVPAVENPLGYQAALRERSNGKDTMTGHWEIMGIETKKPFKTFTEHGFPKELIEELEKRTGHKVIGNKSASGTEIIDELMPLIKCENVSIGYEGQTVVKDLNFAIEKGDYLCIVGENGSGKSTLVKSLLGLKSVEKGRITFGDGLRQNEIGYLPQQNDTQKDFPASVYEVVLSGRLNSRGFHPFYTSGDKREAVEKMELLGIRDLERQCFRDLSGGQKQRVLLARALCATKSLLLLDEPVTGLDPIVTGEFYQLIRRINRDSGIAVVMVSHDIESAVEDASHILHLQETALFFGTTEDYRRSRIGRKFLGGVHDGNDF